MQKFLIALFMLAVASHAFAETPTEIQAGYANAVKKTDPAFAGFSAERGKTLYTSKFGKEWSCSSCHTDNPAAVGKHASTGREIKPMAPSANAERFTDPEKVEKLFKRQCDGVMGRECTPLEKGDFIAYLLSVK